MSKCPNYASGLSWNYHILNLLNFKKIIETHVRASYCFSFSLMVVIGLFYHYFFYSAKKILLFFFLQRRFNCVRIAFIPLKFWFHSSKNNVLKTPASFNPCMSYILLVEFRREQKSLSCAFSQQTQIDRHLRRRVVCLHDTLKYPVTIVPTILKGWPFQTV